MMAVLVYKDQNWFLFYFTRRIKNRTRNGIGGE